MLIQSIMNTAAHVGALAAEAADATAHAGQVGQDTSIIIVGGTPQYAATADATAAAPAMHGGQETSIIIVGGAPEHGQAGDPAASAHATQRGQETSIIIVGGLPHELPLHTAVATDAAQSGAHKSLMSIVPAGGLHAIAGGHATAHKTSGVAGSFQRIAGGSEGTQAGAASSPRDASTGLATGRRAYISFFR